MNKLLTFLGFVLLVVIFVHALVDWAERQQIEKTDSWNHCGTDTECAERFGGDGGPGPRVIRVAQ